MVDAGWVLVKLIVGVEIVFLIDFGRLDPLLVRYMSSFLDSLCGKIEYGNECGHQNDHQD
jgi:hypothetical protein